MSNLSSTAEFELCVSEPAAKPTVQVLPGRLTDLGGLPIRRILPRSQRRTVGPWCFLDSYGPVNFSTGKPMDIPPHPHIGLDRLLAARRRSSPPRQSRARGAGQPR